MRKYLYIITSIILLLACFSTYKVTAQFLNVQQVGGTPPCVGNELTFVIMGPGSANSWTVFGSNYTTVSSSSSSITVKWNSAQNNAGVQANGSSSSGSARVNILASATPTISFTTSATTLCQGSQVTFTASSTNAGSSPTYQWFVDGTQVASSTSNTYSTTGLSAGTHTVYVKLLVSGNACVTTTSKNSSSRTITVTSPANLAVSLASPGPMCANSPLGFTATATGPGTKTYTWYKNGVQVTGVSGPPANVFVSATELHNGDKIKCKVTTNASCTTPSPAWSNEVTVSILTPAQITPSLTIGVSDLDICSGENITFTAQSVNSTLSNYQWKKNGSTVGTGSSYTTNSFTESTTITLTANATYSGQCLPTTTQSVTASTANIPINVTTSVIPSVSISASATNICSGQSVTFTATPTHGGSPSYSWRINGSQISSGTSNQFTRTNLNNNDVVSVVMTSTANCRTANTATSNNITMTVGQNNTLAVTLANPGPMCASSPLGFTATATGPGTKTYTWYKNGVQVTGVSGPPANVFVSAAELHNGDKIKCKVTTNASCTTPSPAWSNEVTVSILTPAQITPSLTIGVSDLDICSGENITFTAQSVNSTLSNYQWKKNGSTVGTGSSYTTNSFTESTTITLTANATYSGQCLPTTTQSVTASTANIPINVTTSVTPSVSISASATNICSGQSVTFTATPTHGGSPSYSWRINGSQISSGTSNQFTRTNLNNNDVVSVVMTSTADCRTANTATSNNLTMTVGQNNTLAVTLANPSPMCASSPLGFTATATGPGTKTYTWYKNGIQVSGISGPPVNVFVSPTPLTNNDKIKCKVTTDASCTSPSPAWSNEVTVSILPPAQITPNLDILLSAISICKGDNMTFTANSSNGTLSNIAWRLNGTYVGSEETFTTNELTDASVVDLTATVTYNGQCVPSTSIELTRSTAQIPIFIAPKPNPIIMPSGFITIFSDASQTIQAYPKGNDYVYQWKRNGVAIMGATNDELVVNAEGIYTVDVRYFSCVVNSNDLEVKRNSKPVANAGLDVNGVDVCSTVVLDGSGSYDDDGTIVSYKWTKMSSGQVSMFGAFSSQLTLTDLEVGTHTFGLMVTDNVGESSLVNEITVVVGDASGVIWYADTDGDGLGDPNNFISAPCNEHPEGYVDNNHDQCPFANGFGTNNGCPLPPAILPNGLSDDNYIYVQTPQVPYTGITVSSLDRGNVISAITYFDGLGRPKQSIGIGAGADHSDIVTPMVYDEYGRQRREYLPYATSSESGRIFMDPLGDVFDFYGTEKYENTSNPYSEKEFEPSPLNRVVKQAAPGEDWKLGNGHEIEFGYEFNLADEVRLFTVTLSADYTPALNNSSSSYYGVGQLSKTITRDENHSGTSKDHTTEEFKDKQGRVVLKRTYDSEVAHDTYYVYDIYGNLSYVLPPKVNTVDGVSSTELNELCYQYKYDSRNRLVEKKIPGKAWEYIVYNKLDQPVLTQDANLSAQGKWLFTKYDAFGRVAYTGVANISNIISRTTLQGEIDAMTTPLWVTKQGSAASFGSASVFYNNGAYPISTVSEVQTINYYDNYTFDLAGLTVPTGNIYGQTIATGTSLKGLTTGSKVRALGTNNWITTITAYDVKGRAIYVASKNDYLNTIDVVETKLDFTGKVIESKTTHAKGSNESIVTIDMFTYDHAGRILAQTQRLNGGPEVLIAENHYDELGQLVRKDVGNVSSDPLQSLDYQYNIRGWLKQINDTNNLGDDLFAFKINYNEKDINDNAGRPYKPLYNGNIAETQWRSATYDVKKGYEYAYDALNRLNAGQYGEGAGLITTNSYAMASFYDKNGNITSLHRFGANQNYIDNLTYDYDSGNKLLSVSDAQSSPEGFNDGNTAGNDYSYDQNGNLIADANKDIATITYNHLNLPAAVEKTNGDRIEYVYDALGTKIAKRVFENGGTTQTKLTEYAGAGIYEDGALQFINHAEGRIVPDPTESDWDYEYFLKDHLGNTRVVFTSDPKEITYTLNYENNSSLQDDAQFFEEDESNIIPNNIFDHTDVGTGYTRSQMLSGAQGSQVGSVLILPVSKGDKVNARVYAKYLAPSGNNVNTGVTALANLLANAMTGGSVMTVDGAAQTLSSGIGNGFIIGGSGFDYEDDNAPKAFLNVMFLPEGETLNLDQSNFAFDQIDDNAIATHDLMQVEDFDAPAAGYVVVYLSNEDGVFTEVYFDDLAVTVNESMIIQSQDYYPFGLAFNEYNRVTAKENKFKYSGKELNEELGLDWYDYGARQYHPTLGRWFNIDNKAELYFSSSVYTYSLNSPLIFNDPDGEKVVWANEGENEDSEETRKRRMEIGSLIHEMRKKSKEFNTLFEKLHAADNEYQIEITEEESQIGIDAIVIPNSEFNIIGSDSNFTPILEKGNPGATLTVYFGQLKKDNLELQDVLAEEFVHLYQQQFYVGDNSFDYDKKPDGVNIEYEAKAISGWIKKQAGINLNENGSGWAERKGISYFKKLKTLNNYSEDAKNWLNLPDIQKTMYAKKAFNSSQPPSLLITLIKSK